jgi:NADH-quinone oxidoreductase subunit M
LLFSLALIGLPGTLGFVAEDLLFHGTLHRFPVLGIALPLATALNAIYLLRLYHLLFNGVLPKDVAAIPDALRREALPLLLGCALLIVLGVVPDIALSWSGPASTWLVDRLAHIIHP